jgi:hypothetical protein
MAIRASSISTAVLPASPLQAEIAEQDGRQKEGNHCDRDCRALAELAAWDSTLE